MSAAIHDWETESIPGGARVARVFSPTNIALAKYWGKRHTALNLPTNSSLSATLADYGSFTTVAFHKDFPKDRLILNGAEQSGGKAGKVFGVLCDLREIVECDDHAVVMSRNNFPTAAGLASSASGLSAVTFAAAHALGLGRDLTKLSEVARRGSGSACRSLFGGFVEWARGQRDDGEDSVAHQVAGADHWPLAAFLVIATQAEKHQPSTNGMEITRRTSPYFDAWVEAAEASVPVIREAVLKRDFEGLAAEAESNCLRFHASAMAATPPVLYWQGATLDAVHRVWELRRQGVQAFFTIDAGANVVVFADPAHAAKTLEGLKALKGVEILQTRVGEGARLL